MTLDPQLLTDAIERQDAAGVRELLRGATEADRRSCARSLAPFLRGPSNAIWERVMAPVRQVTDYARDHPAEYARDARALEDYKQHRELRGSIAFLAAELGLAGGVAAAARAGQDRASWRETAEQDLAAVAGVLADRNPEWLADFVDRILGGAAFEFGMEAWPLARALVRLGVIERPGIGAYTTQLPYAVRPPYQGLLADPGLLDDEVWRLFTVPDAGWVLDRHDSRQFRPPDLPTWLDDLARLSEDGQLDRDRLIDACLDAFTRDFAPTRVGWYGRFHDRLNPSLAELRARTAKYLTLLGNGSKVAVAIGQLGAGRLLEAGLVEPLRLVSASGPALLFPQKSIAMTQLRMIDKAIASDPAIRDLAVTTAAQAFGHQREDVQEAALRLVRKHGMPDGARLAEIRELATALSATLAADAQAMGLPPDPATRADLEPAPALDATGLGELERRIEALPDRRLSARLTASLAAARRGEVAGPAQVAPSAGQPVRPVDDPAGLVELLIMLIEDASDAIAVERAIAGAVRLSALPEHDRGKLAGPLLNRAEARAAEGYYGPFSGRLVTAEVAQIALAWGTGRIWRSEYWSEGSDSMELEHGWISADRSGKALTMAGVFSARASEAATVITGRPGRSQLLAEPEFDRGAISPATLLDRLARRQAASPGQPPGRYDLEAALLRLVPDADDGFWSAWARMDAATAASARRSYDDSRAALRFTPVVGPPAGRQPLRGYHEWHRHVLARLTVAQPAAGRSRTWALLTALTKPMADHAKLYGPSCDNRHYGPAVAGWPLICPWQPELAAAHLLRALSDGLKAGPSPATAAVSCLAHPGHPLGPIGHLALVVGLASAEADTRIASADVWVRASLDGRLDPALAAEAIVTGAAGQAIKLNRIASGLEHAAHTPIAAYRIVETISLASPALIRLAAPGIQLVLELAARLGSSVGVPALPSSIAELGAHPAGSRAAASAARLLQAAGRPATDRAEAAAQSLAALIARTEDSGQ